MAVEVATAYVSIVPTIEGIQGKLAQSLGGPVEDEADKAGRRAGNSFTNSFGKVAAAIGGVFAAQKLFDFGKGAFDAAIESQKIAAQSEAVIKSMGLEATVSADRIGDLAEALSKKNAVDDEAIQSGQNLLLTFGNLASTADEQGGAFERASQVMVDMAAAMGTDASSSAIQLGKALNDPKQGLSALTRVGVSFTEEQKEQIKAMQESGDMAGAQAVLLAELERQFGGSAEAQATATDRLKIAFGNLQEEVGARLIPVVERFSTWMVEDGIPALQRFGRWVEQNVVPVLVELGRILRDTVLPALMNVGEFIIDNQPVLIGVIAALAAGFLVWAINAGLAAAATIAATWPVIAIAAAIAGLVALVIYAYQEWDWFRNTVDAVASFLTNTLWPALQTIARFIADEIVPRVRDLISIWWDFHSAIFRIVVEVIEKVTEIVTFVAGLPETIKQKAGEMWEGLKNGLQAAVDWILRQIDRILGPLDEAISKLDVLKRLPGVGKGTALQDALDAQNRASGGPVRAGYPYIVGEHRPELFVPNADGYIHPTVGGGRNVTLNLNATYTDPNPLEWVREAEFLAGFN